MPIAKSMKNLFNFPIIGHNSLFSCDSLSKKTKIYNKKMYIMLFFWQIFY